MLRCRTLVVVALVTAIIAACAGSDAADPATAADATAGDPTSTAGQGPQDAPVSADVTSDDEPNDDSNDGPDPWRGGGSDHIFDQDTLHTFELTLSEEALARIDADPAAEEYVEGHLRFEGHDVGAVGVRYKGSVGAFVNCLEDSALFEPSGAKTCTKLSMKVKINWDDPDTEFYGLRRLQFHAQNLDQSQLRERLGYWLFNEMGVPAPRSVHARLVINGSYVGLFALTEQIDGRFTRDRFPDGTGNLYKEVWPLDDRGRPHPSDRYLGALRTNEDDDPSAEVIAAFAAELAGADSDDARRAVLERWTDVDELLAYAVVDRTIRHDDGPFHWYCGPQECAPHNFYFYEDPSAKTLHLIAWDLDNAFENILGEANPVTPVPDGWGETRNDCAPFPYGSFGLRQRSAACDPLVATLVLYSDEYDRLLTELVEGPLAPDQVDPMIDAWVDQIAAATAEADALHDDAVTEAQWMAAVTRLRDSLDTARATAG